MTYTRKDIAGLAIKNLTEQCERILTQHAKSIKKIVKGERDEWLERIHWILWREAALFKIKLGEYFGDLNDHSTRTHKIGLWLGLAGLGMMCERLPNPVSKTDAWQEIRKDKDVYANVACRLRELT